MEVRTPPGTERMTHVHLSEEDLEHDTIKAKQAVNYNQPNSVQRVINVTFK